MRNGADRPYVVEISSMETTSDGAWKRVRSHKPQILNSVKRKRTIDGEGELEGRWRIELNFTRALRKSRCQGYERV
jgi:hypothetical protein